MSDKDKLKARFNLAADTVKKLKKRPSDNELLVLYAYYKQSTIGNCNVEKPNIFDPTGGAKWTAWNKLKGTYKCVAMEKYVDYAMKLIEKYFT